METAEYLAALDRETAAFRAAVAGAAMDTAVPSAPEWQLGDLIHHLTEVHYFWGEVIRTQATGWQQIPRLERADGDGLVAAFERHSTALADTLRVTPPQTRVWTWSDQQDAAFVLRRMPIETAIHRWDAEMAVGAPNPVAADLASDAIDEFLTHFLPDVRADAAPVDGSVHIHCGDVAGEWTIRPGDEGGYAVTREHAKGDCALRGGASDLLLALWRRVDVADLDVVGDADVAARFLAATDLS